jgi:hypothetical protein
MSQKQRTRRSKYRTGGNGRTNVTLVNSEARDVLSPQQLEALRHDCGRAGRITDPLEPELWASAALGRMWTLRRTAQAAGGRDWEFGLGAPVARELARVGGTGAKGQLLAWGRLASGRFGDLCAELADGLTDTPTPPWVEALGAAQVRLALSDQRAGDGEVIALELARTSSASSPSMLSPSTETFALAAFIDERHGGIAKRLGRLGTLEEIAPQTERGEAADAAGLRFSPLAPSEACWRIRRAIVRTDAALDPPLSAGFADLRALVLAFTAPAPSPPGRREMAADAHR